MVVVFIIGLMSAAVVMTMPGAERRAVQDAERFAARVAAARDTAVLTARPVRVWVAASGYGFDTRVKGAWAAMPDSALENGNWQEGLSLTTNAGEGGAAQIIFDASGMPDRALALTLYSGEQRAVVNVTGSGEVRVDAQ